MVRCPACGEHLDATGADEHPIRCDKCGFVVESDSRDEQNGDAYEEVPLGGTLSQFRVALREEISAARRSPSTDVPLSAGRRIVLIAGKYQYRFQLEPILNVPTESRADLIFCAESPIEVMILSVDAMQVIISSPIDLGASVPAARLRSNMSLPRSPGRVGLEIMLPRN